MSSVTEDEHYRDLQHAISAALQQNEALYFRHGPESFVDKYGNPVRSPFKELDHQALARIIIDIIVTNVGRVEQDFRSQIADEVERLAGMDAFTDLSTVTALIRNTDKGSSE